MPHFSHLPLQKSIYERLTGDAGLMAMVSGVHDRPPQGAVFPYITIGECAGRDWSSKTTSGSEQIASLHVWSREGGRKEASNIMAQIYDLLHDADLTVDDHVFVMLRFVSSNILLERDGWTYEGIMKFHALLQSA